MIHILDSSQKRSKREILLMFDLKKAFDSINRNQLWNILVSRAKTPGERAIFERLCRLHHKTEVWVGDQHFTANKGIPQGGCESPDLFNVYLQEALFSQKTLRELISQGRLLCFADDIVVRV